MNRILLGVVAAMLCAAHMKAGLLVGHTISTSYLYPVTGSLYAGPVNSVVGAGPELAGFAGFVSIDFSDTNILITTTRDAFVNNVAFDGLQFTDLNGLNPSAVVSVNSATNYSGFDSSRVWRVGDSIFVSVANLPGLRGQIISLDLALTTPTPEPAGFALAALGVGLLGFLRVRATKR